MEGKQDIWLNESPSATDYRSPPVSPKIFSQVPSPDSSNINQGRSFSPGNASPPTTSLEAVFNQLELSELPLLPLSRMFNTVRTSFQRIVNRETSEFEFHDWQAVLERAEELSQHDQTDTEALRLVRAILDYLWSNELEEDLVDVAKVLADGSRETALRIPLGDAQILNFFLNVVAAEGVHLNLMSQALRLIGNACADTDKNRENVVSQESIPFIIKQLHDDSLATFAIPVLYNICVDFVPAQDAVRSNLLCPDIINLLARESFDSRSLLNYICPLLIYSIREFDLSSCPDYSVQVLLQTALQPGIDVDDLALLIDAVVICLRVERFQRLLIIQDLVKLPLILIIQSFSPQPASSISLSVTDLTSITRDPEEEEQYSAIRDTLIRALSDVSAAPEFSIKYPLGSSLIKSLLRWLSASQSQCQVCSCIILGNLARSDTVCHGMVHDLHVHEILATIVKDSSDSQILHSALGFLRNLALPAENKAPLGASQIMETVSRFWSMGSIPQVQYGAISLIRQLLNGSLANVRRLLTSLSSDPDSPAHEKTHLSLVLLLFEKTDQAPIKLEIARAMAAIWRCLSTSNQSVDPEIVSLTTRRLLTMHTGVSRPLGMMVTQSQWPIIRSEGWFALALMARSQEGSTAVNDMLQQVEVFGALVETLTGRSIAAVTETSRIPAEGSTSLSTPESPVAAIRTEQEKEMRLRDRENVMVLINELLKNSGDDMSMVRRRVLEDLLRGRHSQLSFQELMLRAQSLE